METRKIGSLEVSLVGLGCNNFGMRCDEARSVAVVHAALDAGITFFDTADVYGGTKSEEFLGRALGGRRSDAVVATKFGASLGEGRAAASARWITEAIEGSLHRLGTDYVDLYQQHVPDDTVPIEETQATLDDLVRQGKVREIGNSNFSGVQIDAAARLSAERGWARFVSAQNQFSLLARGPLRDVVPACERNGLSMLPYFPLASGMLSGKYRRGAPLPTGTRLSTMPEDRAAQLLSDKNFDRVEALTEYAAGQGHAVLELAFAWLARQPTMGSIIAGATSPEQVRANASGVDWQLSDKDLSEVERILERG